MADKDKSKFVINEQAWNKMQQYAKIAYETDKNEISGICLVRKAKHPIDDREVWELFDPCILKQENSGTNTILNKDVLPQYYIDMAKKHGTDIRYCWWHSHHTMDAFWSGTDKNEINAWKNSSWSIALVINLRQEYCLNVSTWDPVEHSEDVPLEILRDMHEPSKEMIAEYKEKCSDIVHSVSTSYKSGYGYGNYHGQLSMIGKEPEKAKTLTWDVNCTKADIMMVFSNTGEWLDDLNGEYITDKVQYPEYKKKIFACNKRLKEVNARFKIRILPKAKLNNACMHTEPEGFFEYDNDETEMAYQTCLAEQEAIEYGGYGWV